MLVVSHLVQYGHRAISVISGPDTSEWQRERLVGLTQEFERYGLSLKPDDVFFGPISFETGRQGVARRINRSSAPTAIICGHDVIAAGALAKLRELKIAVPNYVSLTGFEDLELASNVSPPLTTVRFPTRALGAEAGHRILKRFAGTQPEPPVELDITLLARESSGPPRKTHGPG